MDQREELIRGQLKDAQDQKESAGRLKDQYEAAVASAKEESGQIVERARTEASLQAEAIVKNANEQAGQIVDKAKKDHGSGERADDAGDEIPDRGYCFNGRF